MVFKISGIVGIGIVFECAATISHIDHRPGITYCKGRELAKKQLAGESREERTLSVLYAEGKTPYWKAMPVAQGNLKG
jgi:hypothetical protein